jgi:hypothetical protein
VCLSLFTISQVESLMFLTMVYIQILLRNVRLGRQLLTMKNTPAYLIYTFYYWSYTACSKLAHLSLYTISQVESLMLLILVNIWILLRYFRLGRKLLTMKNTPAYLIYTFYYWIYTTCSKLAHISLFTVNQVESIMFLTMVYIPILLGNIRLRRQLLTMKNTTAY